MAVFLFKWWLMFFGFAGNTGLAVHPYFVSVTEIAQNAGEQSLEISCKIFTDDFEKALKNSTGKNIDLLNPKKAEEMKPIVGGYIMKHLSLTVDGKAFKMDYLGFEKDEEGIRAFFEVKGISSVHKLGVLNNLLYEYHPNQISLIHVTVNGKRKSTKLDNPEEKAEFVF